MNKLLFNKRHIIFYIISFFIFIISINLISFKTSAMTPKCYDYKTVLEKLPSNLQKDDFIINSNGVALLVFATYKNSGSNYRTTMKHSSDNLYYCVNYSAHFTAEKDFIVNDSVFSDELRARIAFAIHLGANEWNTKAASDYTTGNFVEDYYMTQLVIHGLIYKYGGNYKNHGVDLDNISFKNNTGNLEKKTLAFYKACCKAIYSDKTGSYQKYKFSFKKPGKDYLYLSDDGSNLLSSQISCNTDADNANVSEFTRTANLLNAANETVLTNIYTQTENTYNSAFNFSIPTASLDMLEPGVYTATVKESATFHRAIAKEWKCQDKDFKDNQEVAGIAYTNSKASDSLSLKLIIGKIELFKTDSLTGEVISDAEFQLYQFDENVGDYVFYKNFAFDSNDQKYYSGNIYLNANNPNGKFKIVESKPGNNYINDWNGHEFTLSDNNTNISINVENAPILGSMHVQKKGIGFEYNSEEKIFNKSNKDIPLPKVRFEIYADRNITYKDVLIYQKDQKILEFETDNNGEATINNLIPGMYYIKEVDTNPLYVLDSIKTNFEIKKENGTYADINYSFFNYLKQCSISLYKYTNNSDKPENRIPVSDCKFGLFLKNDLLDAQGNKILEKDSMISEAITDNKGELEFKNLLYADYYIKELEVPNGIIINNDPIDITKDKFELKAETTDEYAASVNVFNEKQKYKISLLKYGEQFYNAEPVDSDNGTFYSYQLQEAPLKGVSYSLYNENNELLMTRSTDDNGIISFEPLDYGNYYCIEEAAPVSHLIDKNPINISCTTLEPKDEDTGIITLEQSANNKMFDCTINVQKMGERCYIDNGMLKYSNIPLSGIVFGIYQDFDYTFSSGLLLAKDTCVGYITTDDKGLGVFNGKLPEGNYYLKELKTLSGYDIDPDNHSFEIKANNNTNIIIDFTKEPLINYLSKTNVRLHKTDSNTGKSLKGVKFTLYNQNDKKIGVYTTNKKGEIIVENLPYGNYYFIETQSLKGYYSSNNHYRFTLNSEEEKLLEITNTPILKLGFNEHYKIYFIIICILILCGSFFLCKSTLSRKNDDA